MALQAPFNYLHRRSRASAGAGPRFQILAWAQDDATFTPKSAPGPVTRPVIRVWMRRLDRPSPVPYYDLSASTLQAQIIGYLRTGAYVGLEFSIRAFGTGNSKRFGLNVRPLGAL